MGTAMEERYRNRTTYYIGWIVHSSLISRLPVGDTSNVVQNLPKSSTTLNHPPDMAGEQGRGLGPHSLKVPLGLLLPELPQARRGFEQRFCSTTQPPSPGGRRLCPASSSLFSLHHSAGYPPINPFQILSRKWLLWVLLAEKSCLLTPS